MVGLLHNKAFHPYIDIAGVIIPDLYPTEPKRYIVGTLNLFTQRTTLFRLNYIAQTVVSSLLLDYSQPGWIINDALSKVP